MNWHEYHEIEQKWIVTPDDLEDCKLLHPELANDPEFAKIAKQVQDKLDAEIFGKLEVPFAGIDFASGVSFTATSAATSAMPSGEDLITQLKELAAKFPTPKPKAGMFVPPICKGVPAGFKCLSDWGLSLASSMAALQDSYLAKLAKEYFQDRIPEHADSTLALAGRVFDRNIQVLAKYHRLGLWRFAKHAEKGSS